MVTFCRLAITRLQNRQRQTESPRRPSRRQKRLAAAERVEDRENIAVSAIEAVAGVLRPAEACCLEFDHGGVTIILLRKR